MITDLIKIDVSDNFVNLSEHFKQMTGDLSFEKRTQREFAVLLCFGSVRITGLPDMAIYLQLIVKNHPIGQLWISKQRLKAKCQSLITMDSKKA